MKVTRVIQEVAELRGWRRENAGRTIGFVPTMGALHAGHATLLRRARRENELLVLSVFVNPTQFNDPKDFEKYPLTFEADLSLAEAEGVDLLFFPRRETLYADEYRYKVTESKQSRDLCGAHRPGHFDGVLTVVLKLLNLVRATRAYFGEKDFQQLELVRGMVEALFLDVEIVPVPTAREADGLALSSRNTRLGPDQRARAAVFPGVLFHARSADTAADELRAAGFAVDYVEDRGGRRFGAVTISGVRLIDNVVLAAGNPGGTPEFAGE